MSQFETEEKRRLIDTFVKTMCYACTHALEAREALEMGIPSEPTMAECAVEFKKATRLFDRLMEMSDAPEEVPAAHESAFATSISNFGFVQEGS